MIELATFQQKGETLYMHVRQTKIQVKVIMSLKVLLFI